MFTSYKDRGEGEVKDKDSKVPKKQRQQIAVLVVILLLNTSWLQRFFTNNNETYSEISMSSRVVSLKGASRDANEISRATPKEVIQGCLKVKDKKRNQLLENQFESAETDLDITSLTWDIQVFDITCVTEDTNGNEKEEVKTLFDVQSHISEDAEIDTCEGCLEKAVDLEVSIIGHMGKVTQKNIHDLADVIDARVQSEQKNLKKYIANYKKNKESVELKCTHLWKQTKKGVVSKVNSTDDVKACRMEALSNYNFSSESKREKYFMKHFYRPLKKALTHGHKDNLDDVAEQIELFIDHDSSAIRTAAHQLRSMHRAIQTTFRWDQSYTKDLAYHCGRYRSASPSPYMTHQGAHRGESSTMELYYSNCKNSIERNYRLRLDHLNSRVQQAIPTMVSSRPHSRQLEEETANILQDFNERIQALSLRPGSLSRNGEDASFILPEFHRREADMSLGAYGYVTGFDDANEPLPHVSSEIDVQGFRFRE